MKRNLGKMDKTVRIILAVIAGLLVYLEFVDGIVSYVLLAIAAILVLTSLVNFCPIYGLFGINSCKSR